MASGVVFVTAEEYAVDQLGSAYSDQPDDADLWELDRFVDEVEQVRAALGLDRSSFFLLGHSWGGMLAIEYALRYQDQLRGLVISNMVSSFPAALDYFPSVLMPTPDPAALGEIKDLEVRGATEDPRYVELVKEHLPDRLFLQHFLPMPVEERPDPVNRAMNRINHPLCDVMLGPSGLGLSGKLADGDRSRDLHRITVPTLVIGARHDFMDPANLETMASRLPRGRYLECANGSHLPMYDDQETFFGGLIDFLLDHGGES